MHRREFLGLLAATVTATTLCGVATSVACNEDAPSNRKMSVAAWFQKNHEELIFRANYEAFRQRLRTLLEDGNDFLCFELHAPSGGFRHARVFTTKGVISWEQPWDGDCI